MNEEIIKRTTDSKVTESAVKRSDQEYRNLLTDMCDSVIENDTEGKIKFANDEALAKILRFDQPEGILGRNVMEFIIELKRAEETLKENVRKYRDLFELAPDVIAIIDIRGNITSINSAVQRFSGYSKDEIVGRHFSKLGFLQKKNLTKYIKMFRLLLKGDVPEPFEVEYFHKDGSSRWVEVYVDLLEVGGKKVGIQAIMRDITQRKETEKALKAGKASFNGIVEKNMDGIVVVDHDGIIQFANHAAKKMLHHKMKNLIGEPFGYSLNAEGVFEIMCSRINGETGIAELRCDITTWDEKTAYLVSIRDITERIGAEEKLLESEKKLSEQNMLLKEKDIALREVMGQINNEKAQLINRVQDQVNQLLVPILKMIKIERLKFNPSTMGLLETYEKNLSSLFEGQTSLNMPSLTPKEVEVCKMIKNGLTSKEIASIMKKSYKTINTHRSNIRKKFGIVSKGINLGTYLNSM